MKAFIDTSALLKRYQEEAGSEALNEQLDAVSEIVVAPICWLEVNSAVQRKLNEKLLSVQAAAWVLNEVRKDAASFNHVLWNSNLEDLAAKLIHRHNLRALDSIQLASVCMTRPDVFILSDRKLLRAAENESINVKFIL